MKKIISLALFCIIIFINGCVTLSTRLEQAKKENTEKINTIPDGYKIAIISLIGNQLELYKEGMTNLDSYIKRIDVSAWNMDSFVADTITTTISPKFIITKINDSENSNYVFSKKEITVNNSMNDWVVSREDFGASTFVKKNQSLISNIAGTGVDAILVVAPTTASYNNYKRFLYNYGLHKNTVYVMSITNIFCAIDLELVETKTMKSIVRTAFPAGVDPIDSIYWLQDSENPSKESLDTLQPIVKGYIKKLIKTHLQSMALLGTDKQ